MRRSIKYPPTDVRRPQRSKFPGKMDTIGGDWMPDKEKVIKGIECCKAACGAGNCPYWNGSMIDGSCMLKLHADALTLLKEKEWNVLTEDADGVIHGLPGDDGQYLMTDGKDIWIDDYVDGVTDGIILDSGRDIREITAWMHMPDLPKKDRW